MRHHEIIEAKQPDVTKQRLRRAVAQGFRTLAYHATPENFDSFDPQFAGKQLNTIISHAGLNFTTDRTTVNQYADFFADKGGYPQIMPVFLKMKKPFIMDFKSWDEPAASEVGAQIKSARRRGYDAIWMKHFRHYLPMKNNTLLYSLSDLIVVFDPSQVRSIFGNFSDDKEDGAMLMDAASHS